MRVFLFVFSLLSLVSLEEAPSLRKITEHLSVVSRLTTGICIQNDLSENKMTGNQVFSTMIQSGNPKILDELKEFESNGTSKNLDDFSTILNSFGDSSIEKPDYLRERLEILPGFLENVELVESASQANLTEEFRTKAAEVTDGKVNIRESSIGEIPLSRFSESLGAILDENLSAFPTEPEDILELKMAILKFRDEIDEYKGSIPKLKDYETEFNKLFELENYDLDQMMKPVKEMAELGMEYATSQLVGNEIIDSLKSLKGESEKLETSNLLNNSELMDNLIKELDEISPLMNDLTTVQSNSKPNQLKKIFETDLTENWFLEKFAEGEQGYMEKLKKSMTLLKGFSEKMDIVLKEFEQFPSNSSEILSFKRIVEQIKKIKEKISDFEDASSTIQTSLDSSIQCLETNPLADSEKDADLDLFDETHQFSVDLQKQITQFHESMKTLVSLSGIQDDALLDELKKKIGDDLTVQMTETEGWDIITALRSVPKVKEFFDSMKKAEDLIAEATSSELNDLLEKKIEFDVISQTQNIFSDTNFTQALNCLKQLNDPVFNPSNSIHLMNLIDEVRNLKEDDILGTNGILEKAEGIKRSLNDLDGGTNRTKRDSTETEEKQLLKLEGSKDKVEDLEKGVLVLNKIIQVADEKDSLLAITSFDDKIQDAVSSIQSPPMQSIWTPENRQKMKTILDEIDQLEKIASEEKDLQSEFQFLNNATIVNGLPLDTHPFKEEIPNELALSKDQEIRDAAPVFQKLGDLDLDFAAHHDSLKTASQTLDPLRKFFDDFFGIDRTPKKAEVNETANGSAALSGKKDEDDSWLLLVAGAGVIILAIICCIIICCCLKKRKRNKKLNDKETWRHLRFLSEGILQDSPDSAETGCQYTPLHLAVLKKKIDKVKSLVKSGAFVDVHCYGKVCETPLHTAVSNNSTEIVEFLIKSGADLNALDSNYETPLDRANNKKMQNLIKGYKNKTFKKTLPQVLPVDKYKIFIDEEVKGKKEFCNRFKANIVKNIDKATHVIVKTVKEGTFELENSDTSLVYLGIICSHKMLMSSDWMKASLEKKSNFRDDFKFRVKKVKFNEKTFKKIDDIQLGNSKMNVPYLTNTTIHFDQADLHTIDWTVLRKIAIDLGSQHVMEFPVMQGMMAGQCPYYREDMGHVFVIYAESNADKLTTMYPLLKTDKSYSFLNREEFIELLLSQKVVHKKLKHGGKGGKSKETTGTMGTTRTMGETGGSMEKTTPSKSGTPTPVETKTPSATPSAEDPQASA